MKKLLSMFIHSLKRNYVVKPQYVYKNSLSLRCFSSYSQRSSKFGGDDTPVFKPQRVVILSRITRYEFEKLRYKNLTEDELKQKLSRNKSDYQTMLERHQTHYTCLQLMEQKLLKRGIETKVVKRPQLTQDLLEWADVVFTAGGDGTFLDAASKVLTTEKPVIGFNTDPTRSEGQLCLPKQDYSAHKFEQALTRLSLGDFKWKWRQRIRVTMSGHHADDDPIELSDQQIKYLEHRYTEHVAEHEMCSRPINVKGYSFERVLPVRALNEVFCGECLSSRVSYYELSIDETPIDKQKSSGITVCTGTGSSSWHFHINQIPSESVEAILDIANRLSKTSYPTHNIEFVNQVASDFNNSLKFDPSEPSLGFTIRDPVINGVFQAEQRRGKAKKIELRSRMWDACLVVDGGSSFRFNDRAIATMELLDEDALRTVEF